MNAARRTVSGVGVLLAGGAALTVWGAGLAADGTGAAVDVLAHPAPDTAERLLVGVAGLGISCSGAWLLVVAAVCLRDLAAGQAHRRPSGVFRPRALRAVVLGACVPTLGAAALATAAPATADTGDDRPPQPAAVGIASRLAGLPLPERPVEGLRRLQDHRPGAGHARTHVVRRGECLWTIAADLLDDRAGAAEVDRAWHVLYRVNRRAIGDDPDLVRPTQKLYVPASLQSSR